MSDNTFNILANAEFVCANAEHVAINPEGIKACAETLLKVMDVKMMDWKSHPLHPQTNDNVLDRIFVMDLLNFSFWHERSAKDRYQVSCQGKAYTGYWSLCAAIQKSIEAGIPITTPAYYSTATNVELKACFATDNPDTQESMPLFETRCDMLRRAGTILCEQFDSSFTNMVMEANKSAQKLISLVVKTFGVLFDDSIVYKGRNITFHKRAQILVADIWACFQGLGIGCFEDIDSITMFADYRVPQALLFLNAFTYSPALMSILREHEAYHQTKAVSLEPNTSFMFARGNQYEIEIRAASIWSVELVLRQMKTMLKALKNESSLNAILLDFYLWDFAKDHTAEMKHMPIHYTRSIYY